MVDKRYSQVDPQARLPDIQDVHVDVLPPASAPKMPTPRDVARIPTAVRDHAVRMHELATADRGHRKIWTAMRDAHKAGKPAGDVLWATLLMWDNERALAMAAEVYRGQLAENDRLPIDERWSPTVLANWVAMTQVHTKP